MFANVRVFELVQAYRRHGHLLAPINPLQKAAEAVPELSLERLGFKKEELNQRFPSCGFCSSEEAPLQEIIEAIAKIYSSRIGVEYMDLGSSEMERWIQQRLEPRLTIDLPIEKKKMILEHLNLVHDPGSVVAPSFPLLLGFPW